jgi:hypothetical protein
MPLDELVARFRAAERLPEPARTAALNGARRVFVGKNADTSSEIRLFDQHGRARVRMKVDASGDPALEFLGADGRVVSKLPK